MDVRIRDPAVAALVALRGRGPADSAATRRIEPLSVPASCIVCARGRHSDYPRNFTAKTAKIACLRAEHTGRQGAANPTVGEIRRTAGSKFSELPLRVLPDLIL